MKKYASAFFVIGVCLISGLYAGEKYKSSGTSYDMIKAEERTELPDGKVLINSTVSQHAQVEKADTSFPLPMTNACTCRNTRIEEDEENWTGGGMCFCADADGDCFWSAWEGTQEGGTFSNIQGTGKWKGVQVQGKWMPNTNVPALQAWTVKWEQTVEVP